GPTGPNLQQSGARTHPFVPLQRALNRLPGLSQHTRGGRGPLTAESADESQNPRESHDGEDHHRHPEDDVRRLRPEEVRAARGTRAAGTGPSRPSCVLSVAHASKDEPEHQQTHTEDREDPRTAIPRSASAPRRAVLRRPARGCPRLSDSPTSWMKWIAVSPKVFARKISRPAGIVGSGESAACSTMTIDSKSRCAARRPRICVTASAPSGYGGSLDNSSARRGLGSP